MEIYYDSEVDLIFYYLLIYLVGASISTFWIWLNEYECSISVVLLLLLCIVTKTTHIINVQKLCLDKYFALQMPRFNTKFVWILTPENCCSTDTIKKAHKSSMPKFLFCSCFNRLPTIATNIFCNSRKQ